MNPVEHTTNDAGAAAPVLVAGTAFELNEAVDGTALLLADLANNACGLARTTTSEALRFGLCRYYRLLAREWRSGRDGDEHCVVNDLLDWVRAPAMKEGMQPQDWEMAEYLLRAARLERKFTRAEARVLLRAVDMVDQLTGERLVARRLRNACSLEQFNLECRWLAEWCTEVQNWVMLRAEVR